MKLRLEDNGVPIYVQLREQVLRAIGSGVLKPGEQLPTMRQVAVELRVDLNTVRHAYDELEQTGAIVIQRARGTFVAERPPPLDPVRQARRTEGVAQQAIALAVAGGIDPLEMAHQVLQIMKREGTRK